METRRAARRRRRRASGPRPSASEAAAALVARGRGPRRHAPPRRRPRGPRCCKRRGASGTPPAPRPRPGSARTRPAPPRGRPWRSPRGRRRRRPRARGSARAGGAPRRSPAGSAGRSRSSNARTPRAGRAATLYRISTSKAALSAGVKLMPSRIVPSIGMASSGVTRPPSTTKPPAISSTVSVIVRSGPRSSGATGCCLRQRFQSCWSSRTPPASTPKSGRRLTSTSRQLAQRSVAVETQASAGSFRASQTSSR